MTLKIMTKKQLIILALIFTALTIVSRLIDHPWNFTPLAALALFSGFILPKKYLFLPLLAQFVSDMFIGTYTWQIMLVVYASYAVMALSAFALRERYNFGTVVVSSFGASILFFLASNAAVWLWSGMYSVNLAGLMSSYAAGIPFFRNTMLGDLLFTGVFFGVYEFARFLAAVPMRVNKKTLA